jgi:hypothetical protein
MAKYPWDVANQRNWLARIVEGLEQPDGHKILREISHWTVPAGIKTRRRNLPPLNPPTWLCWQGPLWWLWTNVDDGRLESLPF